MTYVSACGMLTGHSPYIFKYLFTLQRLLHIFVQLKQTWKCAIKYPSFSFGLLFCSPSLFILLPNDDLQREQSKLPKLQLEIISANKTRFIASVAAAGGIQSQNVSYSDSFLSYDTLLNTKSSPRCWEGTPQLCGHSSGSKNSINNTLAFQLPAQMMPFLPS